MDGCCDPACKLCMSRLIARFGMWYCVAHSCKQSDAAHSVQDVHNYCLAKRMSQETNMCMCRTLQDVDHSQGRIRGSMRAQDVAGAPGPIDTYFEGDIVDDVNNTFWTHTWGTSRETDLRHWSKFEGFASIK